MTTAAAGGSCSARPSRISRSAGSGRRRSSGTAAHQGRIRIGVPDHFKQRKLARQLEDLADQIGERLRPVYEHDFRDLPEDERAAALQAVVDALEGADFTDDTLFAVNVDARKLARLVRQRVPVRRAGLAEPAERLHDAVLDES
ncbi:MAG TPA: hypothetical protein VE709_14405 [Pseudonocardiaceae bacterium]|jgi:hypothetical protein|nr:hypothetical protein [Pseudonocardiaceae bacterium]